ncbi:conserved Plasmodium protein, unknown function [Plasmodium gallinaceum]|uniref:Fam-b protein n=1 Tax=Plasmodium gallinaceum TaxID=5849 RepID=A0A1J1GX37_PLAGA|nr:conserved Plasmodium protein, unknown function [Plasmodium gallinaceum]CRG97031.1 conserved Plasmodium protein, unknown function [Plasmodium gallinaceum]
MIILKFLFFIHIFIIYVNSMNPIKRGNENFPVNNITEETDNFDSEYPSFNVHYNFEPKDWKDIELINKKNNDILNDIKNEIVKMKEDKLKINYVLNIQKQQLEELIFLINYIYSNKVKNIVEMPQYLRSGNFDSYKLNNNKIEETYNEINNNIMNKSKFIEKKNFYFNLAEQWIT